MTLSPERVTVTPQPVDARVRLPAPRGSKFSQFLRTTDHNATSDDPGLRQLASHSGNDANHMPEPPPDSSHDGDDR